jgi:hypothetical protein
MREAAKAILLGVVLVSVAYTAAALLPIVWVWRKVKK